MAKLTTVYGPMFAGKTTWLLARVNELAKEGKNSLVFKPRLDDRYGKEAKLYAHSGMIGEAILVDENNPEQMLYLWEAKNEQHQVIIIDEAMFFSDQIVEVVKEMLARELEVVVAGLDTNFKKEPFGIMPQLIKLANEQVGLTAKCYKCGGVAQYSARLSGGTGEIVVGAADSYQPACSLCHTICDDHTVTSYDYPNLRPLAAKSGTLRIEIAADSMRVGKTTAVRVIAEGLRSMGKLVTESYEDWQHNPHLKGSYSDPAKNFLDSQKWFIHRKWEQIVDGTKKKGVVVQDVAPETDYCYALTNLRLGRMSQEHFDEYDKYYRSLDWRAVPRPDLLVYLRVSDKELIRRANTARREFETVDDEYFLMMKKVNREWVKGVSNSQMKILEIDTDKLDFANEEKAKKELVERVIDIMI